MLFSFPFAKKMGRLLPTPLLLVLSFACFPVAESALFQWTPRDNLTFSKGTSEASRDKQWFGFLRRQKITKLADLSYLGCSTAADCSSWLACDKAVRAQPGGHPMLQTHFSTWSESPAVSAWGPDVAALCPDRARFMPDLDFVDSMLRCEPSDKVQTNHCTIEWGLPWVIPVFWVFAIFNLGYCFWTDFLNLGADLYRMPATLVISSVVSFFVADLEVDVIIFLADQDIVPAYQHWKASPEKALIIVGALVPVIITVVAVLLDILNAKRHSNAAIFDFDGGDGDGGMDIDEADEMAQNMAAADPSMPAGGGTAAALRLCSFLGCKRLQGVIEFGRLEFIQELYSTIVSMMVSACLRARVCVPRWSHDGMRQQQQGRRLGDWLRIGLKQNL